MYVSLSKYLQHYAHNLIFFLDIASLRVTVPRQLAGDVSEEELAGLVGRIVASQLAVQEKGTFVFS